jgi:hypothetical protein
MEVKKIKRFDIRHGDKVLRFEQPEAPQKNTVPAFDDAQSVPNPPGDYLKGGLRNPNGAGIVCELKTASALGITGTYHGKFLVETVVVEDAAQSVSTINMMQIAAARGSPASGDTAVLKTRQANTADEWGAWSSYLSTGKQIAPSSLRADLIKPGDGIIAARKTSPPCGKLRASLGGFKARLFCRKFSSFFDNSDAIACKNKSISV